MTTLKNYVSDNREMFMIGVLIAFAAAYALGLRATVCGY